MKLSCFWHFLLAAGCWRGWYCCVLRIQCAICMLLLPAACCSVSIMALLPVCPCQIAINVDNLHRHEVDIKQSTTWYKWISRPNTYIASRDFEHSRQSWDSEVAKASQIGFNHWADMGLHQGQTTANRSGINAWCMPAAYQHTHTCMRKMAHLW